jgi:hypothetical protein
MKKLIALLLLALPLTASADYEASIKRLSKKLEPPAFQKPYMIGYGNYAFRLIHYYHHDGALVAEFVAGRKSYIGFNPGCGDAKDYCPDMYIDAVERLLDSFLADYPDAVYVFRNEYIDAFYGR